MTFLEKLTYNPELKFSNTDLENQIRAIEDKNKEIITDSVVYAMMSSGIVAYLAYYAKHGEIIESEHKMDFFPEFLAFMAVFGAYQGIKSISQYFRNKNYLSSLSEL